MSRISCALALTTVAIGLAAFLFGVRPLRAAQTWPPSPWRLVVAAQWGPDARALAQASGDRQEAEDGCGAAALRVLLRAHGRDVPQRLLWSMCRVPGGGARLGTLARAARAFGHATSVDCDPHLERTAMPAIVHLRRGHFVVLESRDSIGATIFDPGCGRVRVPLDLLRRRASGAVLVLDRAALDAS